MRNKGFTLIEMVVAVGIFALVMTVASGVFISGLKAQRQSLAYQELLDQTSFVAEYMSRSLRMAKKELFSHTFSCLSSQGYNYENLGGDSSRIRFIKYDHGVDQDVCHEFFVESNQLKEYKKNLDTGEESTQPLISADLTINSLVFNLIGHAQTDNLQPKITIFLYIEGKEHSKAKVQTTISQRNLDVRK